MQNLSHKAGLNLPVYVGHLHFTIKTYEKGLGLFWLFQRTCVTVGAYMRLEPPWRAVLFTHWSIEFPVLRQRVIPSSLSSHF